MLASLPSLVTSEISHGGAARCGWRVEFQKIGKGCSDWWFSVARDFLDIDLDTQDLPAPTLRLARCASFSIADCIHVGE